MCRFGEEQIYMNVKQEDMETQNRREDANIARSKNSKTLIIAQFFLVSVNTPMCAVYIHRAITLSLCTCSQTHTELTITTICHKYLSEWWQEEEEETPSQRNRGQVELQNRSS